MKVFRDIDNICIERPVATLGIFDGVHLAHQAVIHKVEQKASEVQGESTLITLWPHPKIVLQKDMNNLSLLNTLEEKICRLEKAGVTNLIIIPFNRDFAQTDFSDFVRNILVGKIHIAHFVVGFNHQFGRNRDGNYENLQKLADELGFGLSQQDPVLIEGEKVSSSSIRKYLLSGEISRGNQFLGYNYSLHGEVVGGNQKGRQIGFPTANIKAGAPFKLVPANGVYAVMVRVKEEVYKGMMNIGCRPTLEEDCEKSILEVHLFNFNGDLYHEGIEIEFIQRIREEKKFENMEKLRLQILSDQERIIEILSPINL